MIPYNRQSISEDDIKNVVEVLRSDFLTQGPVLNDFEKKLEKYTGAEYAIAVSSGTAALHLAYLALGVKSGDIVWSPAISFVATTNAALYCGAEVDFIDIDLKTGCMSIDKLTKKLSGTEKNKIPSVVVVVDYAGHCTDMKSLYKLSNQYGFKIIEDASHALGGEYLGFKVGSNKFSDLTIFSFHPIKSITTGEGGAVTTNSENIAKKIKLLRSHGITKDVASEFSWQYYQNDLGFNYRLTDIQSAIGISQLGRLDNFISKRSEHVSYYKNVLSEELEFVEGFDSNSSHHLLSILLPDRFSHQSVSKLFDFMSENRVMVQKHYIPIYKQPFYVKKYGVISLTETEIFYTRQVSLPLYVDMTKDDICYVSKLMNDFLKVTHE